MRSWLRPLLLLAALLVLASVATGLAAGNSVPATRADQSTRSIGPDDLKPAECSGITLTNLVTGSVTVTGTSGNDLILGSALIDTMSGLGGDDCILGGDLVDVINGGSGNDVCIGGPGIESFLFSSCETAYQ